MFDALGADPSTFVTLSVGKEKVHTAVFGFQTRELMLLPKVLELTSFEVGSLGGVSLSRATSAGMQNARVVYGPDYSASFSAR